VFDIVLALEAVLPTIKYTGWIRFSHAFGAIINWTCNFKRVEGTFLSQFILHISHSSAAANIIEY